MKFPSQVSAGGTWCIMHYTEVIIPSYKKSVFETITFFGKHTLF